MVNKERPYYKRNTTTRDRGNWLEFCNIMATKKRENVRRNGVMNNAKYHREINKLRLKRVSKVYDNIPHFWLQQQEQFQWCGRKPGSNGMCREWRVMREKRWRTLLVGTAWFWSEGTDKIVVKFHKRSWAYHMSEWTEPFRKGEAKEKKTNK